MLAEMQWSLGKPQSPLLRNTIIVSVLLHALLLAGWWPPLFPDMKKESMPGNANNPIRVILPPTKGNAPADVKAKPEEAPPVPPPPPSKPQPEPKAAKAKSAPAASAPPRQASPSVAKGPALLPPPDLAPPQPSAPAPDLSSMIEARRRARGETSPAPSAPPAPPVEDETARNNRIVAANMGSIRAPVLGNDIRRTGGVFSIRRMGPFDAEFVFYGWNKDVNRTMNQLIEVPIGNNPNIRIAVVRRMIAIIREYEREDFTWDSQRLGRVIRLSARAADNAGLEDFFMREFFGG